jgi:hypothetical protein
VTTTRPRTRLEAILACTAAVVASLACVGLASAAMLVPAPADVVPVVATICVVCPLFAAWELPGAVAALWTGPSARRERALEQLRRGLDRLPETEHPLGL